MLTVRKGQLKFLRQIRNEGLENLTLKGHTGSKRDKEKERELNKRQVVRVKPKLLRPEILSKKKCINILLIFS